MRRALAAILLSLTLAGPASAQVTFEGKTIRLIVGSAAGATYDAFARTAAKHLPKYIPGKPGIVVQNMPGAGGLLAANHMFSLADKDGATISLLNRNALLQQIVGNKQARFKSEEFYWLGTPSSYRDDPYLFIVHGDLPVKSAGDMRKAPKPVQVGNSGAAMIDIIKETMGLNVNVISGYDKGALELAFHRKEVDGIGISYANGLTRFPGALEKGEIRAIVQFGTEKRTSVLPNVPTARELAVSEEARALLTFIEAPLSIPFPYAAPPGVPADRAAAMRKAFDELWQASDYAAEIRNQRMLHAPKTGAEVEREVAELARAPAAVIKRYNEVVKAGGD